MKKKFLVALLAVAMALGCVFGMAACGKEEPDPYPAYLYDFMNYAENASGNYTIDGLYFFADNQYVRDLEKYGLDKLEELTIPDTFTKHDITAPVRVIKMIALPALKKINLPEGIVAIEKQAFQFCPELEEITLPNTLEYIGPGAFEGTKLKEITIPAGVKNVDGFRNCKELKSVTFSGEEHTLVAKDRGTFEGCTALEEIDLSKISEIGENAFSECTALKKVTINGDATIGGDAFAYCTALTDLTFTPHKGEGLVLGSCIFRDVTFDSLTIPKFTYEGRDSSGPLVDCKVRHLTFTEATEITSFGDTSELVELNLNEGVTYLRYSLFQENACPVLKELTIPSTVTSIGSFVGLRMLERLNWNAVNAKCYDAWSRATQLFTENTGADGMGIVVKLGEKVESIPDMFNHYAVNVIAVLAEDAKLDEMSFENMKSLCHVELPKTLKTLNSRFLEGTQVMELTVPKSVTSIAESAFSACSKLTDVINLSSVQITRVTKNDSFVPEINVLTSADDINSKLIRYYNYLFYARGYNDYVLLGTDAYDDLSADDILELPNGVFDGKKNGAPKIADTYTLAEGAFYGRHEIAVVMPTFNSGSTYSMITVIPKDCFAYSKIRQVLSPRPQGFIGEGVTIAAYAFQYCENLASFDFTEVTGVSQYTFYYSLNIQTITLPAGCDYLGDLFSYVRPKNIVYNGTAASWLLLANRPTYAGYTVTCTDGEVSSDGTVTLK